MAAKVCESPFPERVGEVAGKIAADAQQRRLAAIGAGSGVWTERRARILQLAEEALGRAAKDLAVARSALGGAPGQDPRLRAGEACDAMEQCCDRLLLLDLLLDPQPRLPAADDEGGNARVRAADALEKAMEMAEDCTSLVAALDRMRSVPQRHDSIDLIDGSAHPGRKILCCFSCR